MKPWTSESYKLYCIRMLNTVFPMPDDNHVFVKVGITHHQNILDRFNPKVNDGYEKNYQDWKISPDFSVRFNDIEKAKKYEHYLLYDLLPPNKYKVWVEDYLGIPDKNYYKNNTGITEMRLLTKQHAKSLIWNLYESRKQNSKNRTNYNE